MNELCSLYNLETETILHLFYDCNISLSFLKQIYAYFIQKWPNIQSFPTRNEFTFGMKTSKFFNKKIYWSYIWNSLSGELGVLMEY